MMFWRKNICLFTIILFLSMFSMSCATHGRRCEIDVLKMNIKMESSKKEDILKICGEPLTKDDNIKQGTEVWHYAYVEKNITGLGVVAHVAGNQASRPTCIGKNKTYEEKL
ncbi:MAG: hypothetical protein CVU51_07700 [Deltaproteobacteria bacterium HGW-Deltaproteobacteria-1]|nr:MAG: hypothetical protein CVU51_07700 [Deltaproteobacteria bacterium HGW-Deltaproteobacteria-1]